MKKTAIIILASLILNNCQSQAKKENSMNIEERMNFIKNNIKKFDYEPLYRLKISTSLNYEIRLNDLSVAKKFNENNGTIWYPINSAILKSGPQNIQIQIKPSYIDENNQREFLNNESSFTLEVEQTSWDKDGSLEEGFVV